eukprot:TRINITY_DN19068_c0_g1_i1.p1 TRINITY_DN19068_c0_g1~~TRINITY_DN19068_c0_g1_i1.p1  ORF type:complete len:282 (-),score=18.43 TRINITY_DN19068_c0_g1_i1:171-1016(-)
MTSSSGTVSSHDEMDHAPPPQSQSRVKLDIGGHRFTTTRATLTSQFEPNSYFTALFSGRHELQLDDDGFFFIDRDGHLFGKILSWLRSGVLPVVASEHERASLLAEAEYFALDGLAHSLRTRASPEAIVQDLPSDEQLRVLMQDPLDACKSANAQEWELLCEFYRASLEDALAFVKNKIAEAVGRGLPLPRRLAFVRSLVEYEDSEYLGNHFSEEWIVCEDDEAFRVLHLPAVRAMLARYVMERFSLSVRLAFSRASMLGPLDSDYDIAEDWVSLEIGHSA